MNVLYEYALNIRIYLGEHALKALNGFNNNAEVFGEKKVSDVKKKHICIAIRIS